MIEKVIILSLSIITLSYFGYAQEGTEIVGGTVPVGTNADTSVKENPWLFRGNAMLVFGQDYALNWAAGGVPAINIKGVGNLNLKYEKNKLVWVSSLDLIYGLQRNMETSLNTKTDDKLEFNTNLGYIIGRNWNFGALVQFKTQFDNAYNGDNELTSSFMTPAYLITAVGFEYKRKMWSFFISPSTAKTTFKTDGRFYHQNAFGVDSGKVAQGSFGAFMRIGFSYDIHPKIFLDTKLELFSDYLHNPEKIDVNFEMRWNFKVTRWLHATLYAALLYDYDVRFDVVDKDGNAKLGKDGNKLTTDKLQFKESFGLSLTYDFKIPDLEKQARKARRQARKS